MSDTANIKLAKAKSAIILNDPFFACLMFKLQFVEDPTCKTAWTDGVRLGFNPDYIDELTMDEVKGLIVHEIGHCLSKHPMRRENRDHKKWNVAGDYVVNEIVLGAGYRLPQGALVDSHYGKMSTEGAYNALPWADEGQDGQDDEQGSDGSGDGQGSAVLTRTRGCVERSGIPRLRQTRTARRKALVRKKPVLPRLKR